MKAYVVVETQFYLFLVLALDGYKWSASRPGRFFPEEKGPRTY